MKEKCILNNTMDLSIPGSTNAPLLTPAIFADNVQDLLGTGTLQVRPSARIVVNSIDDAVSSSPGVTTLRDAINQANADSLEDLIVFDRSLFSTAQTITLKLGELDITHDLDIIAPRDALTGGNLVTVSGSGASRVFEIQSGATVTFNGLIVAGGSVGSIGGGGGIRNSGTLTLDSSIVRNNRSSFFVLPPLSPGNGGFLVPGQGGGIFNSGTLTVQKSTISSNWADFGGGIYGSGGTVTVENSTISGNRADNAGGGIYGSASTVTVENSTISGNSATRDGGGIYGSGTVTVENSTISGNSATRDGGGIYGSDGTVTVENSTISGNSATRDGGGIYGSGGIFGRGGITVENSTISGNSATRDGGGVYKDYTSTLTLLFSTITQNTAANGGGVYQNEVPPFSTAVRGSNNVRNTIIAANLNSIGGVNPDVSGTFTSNGYNLIGSSTDSTGFGVTGDIVGTSANPIDPLLAPLAFNGGRTQTIALLRGSPAINAADPTILPTDPTTDQRGRLRTRRGRADIGAFESSLKE